MNEGIVKEIQKFFDQLSEMFDKMIKMFKDLFANLGGGEE